MATSVTITTPIPTLEEFGKQLGLSKVRQRSLLRLVAGVDSPRNRKRHQTDAGVPVPSKKRTTNRKAANAKPA